MTVLCQTLEVSESGYSSWKNRKASQHCREDARLAAEIQQIFPGAPLPLRESAHSCQAQSARHSDLPQAGYATHAAIGLMCIKLISMSRTGNCWDNAAMESFFATLVKECTNRVRFQSRQEVRSAIFEFFECFYNPVRLHSTLAYMSPLAFEHAAQSKMS